jgi:cell division protein DivIC
MGMFLVTTVVIMLLGVVTVKSVELQAKQDTYTSKVEELQAKIDSENTRTEDLKEYAKYTQTKKYIEEIAKDKLGLVYKNEIIFKEAD